MLEDVAARRVFDAAIKSSQQRHVAGAAAATGAATGAGGALPVKGAHPRGIERVQAALMGKTTMFSPQILMEEGEGGAGCVCGGGMWREEGGG